MKLKEKKKKRNEIKLKYSPDSFLICSMRPQRAAPHRAKGHYTMHELKNVLADCSISRPISLINCDMNILAKALAHIMEEVITHIIHVNQVGFIKCRQRSGYLRQLIASSAISEHSDNSPLVGLLIDTEKPSEELTEMISSKSIRKWDLVTTVDQFIGLHCLALTCSPG